MKKPHHLVILISLLLILLACDWATKYWAANILKNQSNIVLIPNILEFTYTENENLGFSMLRNVEPPYKDIIIYATGILGLAFLLFLLIRYRRKSIFWHIPLILLLAGLLGNRVERAVNGFVVDFIFAHYYRDFTWPIFNVADIIVVIGGIWLVGLFFILNKQEKEAHAKNQASMAEETQKKEETQAKEETQEQ